MKKIFLSFLAFMATNAALVAAPTTVTYVVGDTATKYSWASLSAHDTLLVDEVITITATHDTAASVTNGTYYNEQWYAYKADNSGEFAVSAKKDFYIQSIKVNNNPQKSGVLVEKTSQKELKSDSVFVLNMPVASFQVINGTSGNICARLKSFTIVYDTMAMVVPDQTVKVGDAFQLSALLNETAFTQATWSSDNSEVVAVDVNGFINAKAAGTANLTATAGNGSTATGVITVVEREDESFIESYDSLLMVDTLKPAYSQFEGALGQLYRARNYRYNAQTALAEDIPGVELQYKVGTNKVNFIAYANAKVEGGAKAIAFQWRAVDATKPVMFNVDSTLGAVINLVSLPANGGYDQVQNFGKDLNFKSNMQLRVRISNAASSNIVFGPLTITPYLLYTVKDTTISAKDYAEAGYQFTNDALMDNTDEGEVIYSIVSGAEYAQIDSLTGAVTLLGAGEVTVKAQWAGVSTTYALTINRSKADISFAEDTISKLDNDDPFVVLPTTTVGVGDTIFTSSNKEVAVVDSLTGEVTILAAGETTITAQIAPNGLYEAAEASYLLIVDEHPTALPATRSAAAANRKVMVGDQLYILRDDKTYSVTGAKR